MVILLTVGLVAAFLSFYFLFSIFGSLRRRRVFRAGGAGIAFVLCASLAGTAMVFIFSYFSYSRLTAESHVLDIAFRRINPEEFQARLMKPGEADRFYVLRGDEWQLDARIVTWKPPATVLGLDPIYQVERLSGRYSEIDKEQTEVRTVHALDQGLGLDVWALARKFPFLMPGVDAHYGTATYVPMADGARFEVSLSRDALIARPGNQRASEALGQWGEN